MRMVRFIAIGVVVVLAALLCAQSLSNACRADGNDLSTYLYSARALFEGTDPYRTESVFPYIYPLFLALVIAPLAWLPCVVSAAVWLLLGMAALFYSLRLLACLNDDSPVSAAARVALCLVLFDVIQNNVVNGQINLIVLFLCVLGFHHYVHGRNTGVVLAFGAAAALKVFPLIIIPFFVVRRQWSLAVRVALVFVALCAAPGLVPGVDLHRYYGQYIEDFLSPKLSAEPNSGGRVQFTLAGILASAGIALGAGSVALLILLVPVIAMSWDRRQVRGCPRQRGKMLDFRAFAVYMLLPLLVVPMSQVHHLIMVVPAASYLITRAETNTVHRNVWLPGIAVLAYLSASLLWRGGPLFFVALVALTAGVVFDRSYGRWNCCG